MVAKTSRVIGLLDNSSNENRWGNVLSYYYGSRRGHIIKNDKRFFV